MLSAASHRFSSFRFSELPVEIWVHIFVDYLGFTSYPPLILCLVTTHWNSILKSKEYLSQCIVTLSPEDLMKFSLGASKSILPCLCSHNLLEHSHTENTSRRQSFLNFIKTFPGELCMETNTGRLDNYQKLSYLPLRMVADMLCSANECTAILWHDNSLAKATRILGQELRRRVVPSWSIPATSYYEKAPKNPKIRQSVPAGHPLHRTFRQFELYSHMPNGVNSESSETQAMFSQKSNINIIQQNNSSALRHYSFCPYRSASLYFFPSPPDTPRSRLPIIFPRNSLHQSSREDGKHACYCGMLFLAEALYIAWSSLCRFLSSAVHLTRLSLRGVLFDESSFIFGNFILQTRTLPPAPLRKLYFLECSMCLLPFIRCPKLRILHTSGPTVSLDAFFDVVARSSRTLQFISVHVNPGSVPINLRSMSDTSTFSRFFYVSQLNSSNVGNKSTGVFDIAVQCNTKRPEMVCTSVTVCNVIWVSGLQKFKQFLDTLTFPNLEYLHIEQLPVGQDQVLDPELKHQITISLQSFIYRCGGLSGTLRYIGLQSKDLDFYLQFQSDLYAPLPPFKNLPGLRVLKSSAVFFNMLFDPNPRICPQLYIWHCWRLTPTRGLDREGVTLTVVRKALTIINKMPHLKRVSLPAGVTGVLHFEHITHLRILGDAGSVLKHLIFSQPCSTLKELSVHSYCNLSVLHELIESIGKSIEYLIIRGFIEGDAGRLSRILALCPSLKKISLVHGSNESNNNSPMMKDCIVEDGTIIEGWESKYWRLCFEGKQILRLFPFDWQPRIFQQINQMN